MLPSIDYDMPDHNQNPVTLKGTRNKPREDKSEIATPQLSLTVAESGVLADPSPASSALFYISLLQRMLKELVLSARMTLKA
ncbi:hypothetical protein NliqN6_5539 [Naganishia liquefaciens]|uniref:Uncharacterized protein n=1 Tax=Naganishia liquefaciens TaxID=104408 RepID=A0A8H3TXW0_9TREE|nr:hypothetical protein NliqN6_5539 [Naganishia liquefaciens]